ncbi:dynein regulatory complex protein 1-like isoform X2 [Daktulosphaira vitifoliae]|uniref:dynein regulatory complex protein 1-like isoform X2 n=1 Tax=Daktulosphaira vitifoliae TaxID=58002 RepID=UPI0021A9EF0F|nr:dynein regulatory complex protein 1-like isoform X2 [Daktulosphaira vitifoliae]
MEHLAMGLRQNYYVCRGNPCQFNFRGNVSGVLSCTIATASRLQQLYSGQQRGSILDRLILHNEDNQTIIDIPSPVKKQLESSGFELFEYMEECSQLVTNVLLASDNRENNRRETDKIERDKRLKAIEDESIEAATKFKEICELWPVILDKNDALDIYKQSELQKSRGNNLIEQKNEMINKLKLELAESDSRFLQEQYAQSEDIRILQERIENQVKFIRKQYKNHIDYIRSSIEEQRKKFIDKSNYNWDDFYDKIVVSEINSIDERLAMIDKKEDNIIRQFEINEECVRTLKSELNTELHLIQREFELIKMKCLENVEKLNYNYQVLKRREEEIACAKAAQRRKINKLQDVLSIKRKLVRDTKTEFQDKLKILYEHIEKLKEDIQRYENKTERFSEVQENTYKELWNYSQEQMNSHLKRIFEIDRFIHEKYLLVTWQPPPKLMYSSFTELPSYKNNFITDRVKRDKVIKKDDIVDFSISPYSRYREQAFLNLIMEKTLDNASFLLDDQLLDIINTHSEKNLSLLFNILATCGIKTTITWNQMLFNVREQVICDICQKPVTWHKPETLQSIDKSKMEYQLENQIIGKLIEFTQNHSKNIENILASNEDSVIKSQQRKISETGLLHYFKSFDYAKADSDVSLLTITAIDKSTSNYDTESYENDERVSITQSQQNIKINPRELENTENELNFRCNNLTHPLSISNIDYLRALKKTIDSIKKKNNNHNQQYRTEYFFKNVLSIDDIEKYWKQYLNVFPDENIKLWDNFENAIKLYYQALYSYNRKRNEVEKIEIENKELKKILSTFMDSEKNDNGFQKMFAPKILKQTTVTKLNSKPNNENTVTIYGTQVDIISADKKNQKKNTQK